MQTKQISKLLEQKTIEKAGKRFLTCKDAHDLAHEFDLKLSEIGAVCDSEKIKITSCQLGCFE